jgi:hypothetical protein
MARVPITVMGFRCDHCGHEWIPRDNSKREPRICPSCKSEQWNSPNERKPLTYEEFRDAVRNVLCSNSPLTWTEVRTAAKLPQKFPNNKWVRRMEDDIGLVREHDKHGIIHWRLP